MKTAAIIILFCALITGCTSNNPASTAGSATKAISTESPAPMPPTPALQSPSPQTMAAAQAAYSVPRRLTWPASPTPGIAHYEVQQTTNILSRQFFDLTNAIGTNVIVLTTNQSGTWRIRAINNMNIPSPWTYTSL